MSEAIPLLPQYAFMERRIVKHRDNFKGASRHKGVLGTGDISPRILDLGTRWK
jgi:hypothetical protein